MHRNNPRIISIDSAHPDLSVLSEAATVIQRGGLVAYPTDTYYGIAADPFNAKAVSRLFKVKKRSRSKAILLLINDVAELRVLVDRVSPLAEAVIKQFWPGPLTLIFQAASSLPNALIAGTGKIGIRLPAAPLPSALIRISGFPLTATSANISGQPASVTTLEVAEMIGEDLDLILDGGLCAPLPSTLLDLSDDSPKILREGRVPTASLSVFFGDHASNIECFRP